MEARVLKTFPIEETSGEVWVVEFEGTLYYLECFSGCDVHQTDVRNADGELLLIVRDAGPKEALAKLGATTIQGMPEE